MGEERPDEWEAMRGRRGPTDEEWAAARARFARGVIVKGVALSHHRFGFFVDLGYPVVGLIEIPRVREPGQPVGLQDYPAVGREVTAVVLGA